MVVFHDCGVTISFISGMYYLGCEDGGHMSRYLEIEISKEDADKVIQDVMYSVKLLQDYQNKLHGLV